MLAILDPELRHVSPSRGQSMALIGSLALISIIVGAAAPAPRAAARSNESTVASAPPIGVDLASSQKQPLVKGYPDSREIIDGSRTHKVISMSTLENQRTVTSQSTSTSVSTAVGPVVEAAASVGMKLGMAAGRNALLSLLGSKPAAGKDSDERPVLLARILTSDTSASLRRIAAWGLNEYASQQVATEALANALRRDRDASVREMAAWS